MYWVGDVQTFGQKPKVNVMCLRIYMCVLNDSVKYGEVAWFID